MIYGIMTAVIVCMTMSLRALFLPGKWKYHRLSIENFLFLGFLYITIMVGFALVYLLLELEGLEVLQGDRAVQIGSFFERLHTSLYFSGITLFSVGYGDVVPSGIGRWIALVEAWIGYTIPAAYVVKIVSDWELGKKS
ncbi:potassium channel LctB [Oikeobacillus pervagus]|uniref:Potassium channel LctB n=1 Tax=Oikeobacillus pervagus TaxID=1325931 RepID=A0AAJ1T1F7_9BACI|nr:potassium channel LctB [Oikeobacillus pervagus]